MKKTIPILLALLLLAACVETPDEPFVIQKDQKQMLEMAVRPSSSDGPEAEPAANSGASGAGAGSEAGAASEAVDLYARLEAPRHYTASLSGTEGRLRIEADADVFLPDAELPIARAEAKSFSRDEMRTILDALIPAEMQLVDTYSHWSTKGAYALLIQRAQWAIENWEDSGKYLYDIDDSTPEDVEKKIRQLLKEQSEAPKEAPKIDRNAFDPGYIVATADDIHFCHLTFAIAPWDESVLQMDYVRDNSLNPNVTTRGSAPNEIRLEDAEAAANALLEKLPFDGLVLSEAHHDTYWDNYDRNIPCVRLQYTRAVNGVAETVTNSECVGSTYNHQIGFEKLEVTVDREGVVGMRYNYPYAVKEILADRTNLLPFSKIEDIFRRMILVYRNYLKDGTRDNTTYTYHVTSVRLGLVTIPEENAETVLIVPAWDFLGYLSVKGPNEDRDYSTNGLECFLTVNAIDGSIIDRDG